MTRAPLALALALAACGGARDATSGPAKVAIPVLDTSKAPARAAEGDAREAPPPSGEGRASPFPAVSRTTLPNGLTVATVTAGALPIVQVRVVVRAGSGLAAPGVARVTAEMLKDGGAGELSSAELLRRVETLGADLGVSSELDATVLSIGVPKEHTGEALALVARAVTRPRFDGAELGKLKARLRDEAEERARSSGAWVATATVFRELFPEPSGYARYAAFPSEIMRIELAAVRAFHRRAYVPKATTVVLAGDLDAAAGRQLVAQHFGGWTGAEPPRPAEPRAAASGGRRVVLCHRKGAPQSDVFVATLGPARHTPSWADVRVATQILGGGVASRLFTDVRERRSLAYVARAGVTELARGPQPIVAHAGTQTAKTGEAVAALLENLTAIATRGVTPDETATARRYLSDIFAVKMETVGAIADLVVTQDSLSLPDGYWDTYRAALRAVEAPQASAAARDLDPTDALIVVAGDADLLAQPLARFGPVRVVDPEHELATLRSLPRTP